MSEGQLRWIIAGISMAIAAAYFIWLVTVFIKFQETDRYVRQTLADHYAKPASEGA